MLTIEGYQRGGRGDGGNVTGMKECICQKHQMLYARVESLNHTPETNINCMLPNWTVNKNLKKTVNKNFKKIKTL